MASLSIRSRPNRAACGAVLAGVLGFIAYVLNRPEPPPPPEVLSFPVNPNVENVIFEVPTKKVAGDRGDIRVAYAPMVAQMTRQDRPSPFRFAEIAADSGIDF